MKIAIDISPLTSGHKVRGVGFYIKYLKESLEKHFSHTTFKYFTQTKIIPKDVDIVHYPYFEPFFLTLPLIKKKKTVVTVHDLTPLLFPKDFPPGLKGKIKWLVQRKLLKGVDAIITDSIASKKDIARIVGFPDKKIFVCYLASAKQFTVIKDQVFLKKIKSKYNLPEKFILYVGDVTANKNLPRLIKAILRTNISLVMVGKALTNEAVDFSNPWNNDLKEVIALSQGKVQIKKLGFVSDEDLVALYNLATAFVMPSLYEGFGLPILEAMSSGCPVVTSKEGSLPEVAGDAAYVVDAYSIDAIAEGINKVVGDRQLAQKLREKGLKQAKRFSWEKTAEATVQVYERVIHSS